MKRYVFALFLGVILFSCQKDDDTSFGAGTPKTPVYCHLVEETFTSFSGFTDTIKYIYEEGKLVGEFSSSSSRLHTMKKYLYNSAGEVRWMVYHDTINQTTDTVIGYIHEKGRLTQLLYYDFEGDTVNSSVRFQYHPNGALFKIIEVDGEYSSVIEATSDGKGNIIRLKLLETDGGTPDEQVYVVLEYDDGVNPYYHFPAADEIRYFTPNNILKNTVYVDGQVDEKYTYSFEYDEKKRITSKTETDDESTYVTTYRYACE